MTTVTPYYARSIQPGTGLYNIVQLGIYPNAIQLMECQRCKALIQMHQQWPHTQAHQKEDTNNSLADLQIKALWDHLEQVGLTREAGDEVFHVQ